MKGQGTDIRRGLNTRRFAEALKCSGIDTRHWVSYGTVCTINDEGIPDYTDLRAVYCGPEGVEVDVILEPINVPVTCLYSGIAGGRHTIISAPISPGDLVLVALPDGDPTVPPVIVAILNSAAHKVPLGHDRKPIFRNDHVFIWTDVDIDIRTKNGATVTLAQTGDISFKSNTTAGSTVVDSSTITLKATKVNLGDGAVDAAMKGTAYRNVENIAMQALSAWAALVGTLTGISAAALVTALGVLSPSGVDPYLSTVVKVK